MSQVGALTADLQALEAAMREEAVQRQVRPRAKEPVPTLAEAVAELRRLADEDVRLTEAAMRLRAASEEAYKDAHAAENARHENRKAMKRAAETIKIAGIAEAGVELWHVRSAEEDAG